MSRVLAIRGTEGEREVDYSSLPLKEIQKKIKELVDDEDNFTSDNYGSESADNGFFEVYYSEYNAEETFNKFVEWLFNKKET